MSAPVATAASSAQATQAGLAIAVGYQIERALNQLDVSSLRQSLPGFTAAFAAVVHRNGLASATLAHRYYRQQRAAAGITKPFRVGVADPPPTAQVGRSVQWATKPLWDTQPNLEVARTQLVGAAGKLVLDVGRNTILGNVHRDPAAKGWARITEPAPCAFCALLAIRGAVYRSDKRASFSAHDHCRCHADPIFTAYEPTAEVREWQQLYRDATTSGNSAKTRREWRAAFDAHTTR